MTVTDEQLAAMKENLRVDFDDVGNDTDIKEMISAADSYIRNAVGYVDPENDLYKRAAKLLVNEWYDHRTPTTVGQVSKAMEFSLASILGQLKYCYQAPETGETT